MPTAYSLVPHRFADARHLAFEEGLRRRGYHVVHGAPNTAKRGDVLISWNLHGGKEAIAARFRCAGGRVIVCEEAYFRVVNGEKHFAVALDGHNGSGRWYAGGPERWASFNIELAPWRRDPGPGGHIIVRAQRGIGTRDMRLPPDWHRQMARALKQWTDRPVLVRQHHKTRGQRIDEGLEDALRGCWVVVTWASSIAGRSLARGYPVFVCAPHHALSGAAEQGIATIERPSMRARLPAFERLAWAQWSISECADGLPFKYLLEEL